MKILKLIWRKLKTILLENVGQKLETTAVLLGQLHTQRVKKLGPNAQLSEAEFKVFSQWGEDGIIQYLLNQVPISQKVFVEFGVENYTEANSRFLLINDNFSGLVIDGSQKHINYIQADPIYWRYEIKAVCRFITRENINALISEAGIRGDIALLSIDVDGNDYWIWEALDVINPRIVVCEYNSVFGAKHPVSIPYNPSFSRSRAHYSNLYFGASLPALCHLAKRKGYDFIGSNSAGVNAFFVRHDIAHSLRPLSALEGYVESKLRESRDKQGRLNFVSGMDRLRQIQDFTVIDVVSDQELPLKNLLQ